MPEQSEISAQWFAFTVKPQHEIAVGASLQTNGIEAFVPTYTTLRRWSDRMQTLTLPLFTGYILCHVPFSARLPILRTPGVRNVVAFGNRATAIPDQEIQTIQRMIASGLPLQRLSQFEVGRPVRIIRGPLSGLEGTLAEHAGKCSVVAGIHLLNRSLSVEIEQDAIELIADRPVRACALKTVLLQPRGKPVSFRMTEAEYHQAKSASVARGARCFSDFARTALLEWPQDPSRASCHRDLPNVLEERMAALESALGRLTDFLKSDRSPKATTEIKRISI
jgi:transcription antitermination factor NusG